ncbi:MAG: transcriptional repressor [Candidatus Omnitrophica bacterium]|nr:transcriptional repressor [Candidatus Omnitrophota bacterium]
MDKELDIFIDFLRERNLKLTSQREDILKVFLKIDKHLSVEELYDIVKKKNPRIGQATVFRTLKLLREAGFAGEVNLGDRCIRYEYKYGHKHHDHLICIECGRCIEVVDPKIEELQQILCKREGFSPQKHKMEIFGLCKACRKGSRKAK